MHAHDILSRSRRTHLGVYTCKIVCKICIRYLHTMHSLITDAQVYIKVPDCSWGVHASTPMGMHLITHAHPECRMLYILTEHVHTDYMPMNIRVLEGEGKSYVSWDYVSGRYQETLAGGFHIAILSLIKTFLVLSFSVGFLILWAKDIRTCTCPPLLLRLAFSWDGLVHFWSSLF